jgi:hypothetical protein
MTIIPVQLIFLYLFALINSKVGLGVGFLRGNAGAVGSCLRQFTRVLNLVLRGASSSALSNISS